MDRQRSCLQFRNNEYTKKVEDGIRRNSEMSVNVKGMRSDYNPSNADLRKYIKNNIQNFENCYDSSYEGSYFVKKDGSIGWGYAFNTPTF